MEITRQKLDDRVEEIVVEQQGPWYVVAILGWDGLARTRWKYPRAEDAQAKAEEVARWFNEGRLW